MDGSIRWCRNFSFSLRSAENSKLRLPSVFIAFPEPAVSPVREEQSSHSGVYSDSCRSLTQKERHIMFELVVMILASPVGAAILDLFQDSLYALVVLSDCDECGFNDLGKLLFGGFILAVLVGIAISLLRRRAREKNSASTEFVSIRASDRKQ
jgi:hypothetical protein